MPDTCISHSHHAAMLLAEIEHDTAHVRVFSSFPSSSSQRSSHLITVRSSWRTAHGPYCGYDELWGKPTTSLRDAEDSVPRWPCFPALNVTLICIRPLRIEIDA